MTLPNLQSIARALGGEVSGGQVLAPGPGHSPADRSMSVKPVADAPDGFVVHSHAGNDDLTCKDYVREKLGIERASRKISVPSASIINMQRRVTPPASATLRPSQSAEYIYKLADGTPYLRVKRTAEKQFFQSHWSGGEWINGAPKGPKIPYRLDDMLGAVHDTVFIVEGEKDADNLTAKGFVATTNSGGANKWTPELNEYFAGKRVVVLPDNDEVGASHSQQVASNLHGTASEVRILNLPGLPPKGDVSDWLDAGGDVGKLVDMFQAAPIWTPEAAEVQRPLIVSATQWKWRDPKSIPRRQWLYGWHLIRKFGSAKIAPPGIGKSSLALTEAVAMATDRPLLGIRPRERCRVWYWNGEDPKEEIDRRIAAICVHYNIAPEELAGWLFVDSGRDQEIIIARQARDGATIMEPVATAVVQTIVENRIDVVIVDPFISSHRVTENDNNAIDLVAKRWTAIADETNCAIDLVHHTRKTGGAEATVEDGRGAGSLIAAVRSAQVLNRMTIEEGKQAGVENHREYFKLENGKANLAPPAEGKDWFRIVSTSLGNGVNDDGGDSVGVVTRWTWPDPLAGVTGADFEAAAMAVRAGHWRKDTQAKDWIGKPIAKALRLDLDQRSDRAKVVGLVKAWLKAGSLSGVRP